MASESDIIGRESGGNPYVGYSGVDLSNAPLNKYGFPIWSGAMGPAGISHATGLYQFEPKTWQEGAAALGITDFSPASQKAVYDYTRQKYGETPWAASAPLKSGEHRWVGDVSGGGGQPLYLGTLEKNFHDTGNSLLDALLAQNYPKQDKPTGNGLLDQIMQQAVFGLGPPNQAQPAPDAAKALGRTPQALPPETVPELSGQQVDTKPMQPMQPAAIAPPEPGKEVVPPEQSAPIRTEATPPAPAFQPGAAPRPFDTGNGLLDRILKQLSPIASAQAAETPPAPQPTPVTQVAPPPVQPPPAPPQPQPQQFIEPPAKGQVVPPAVQPRAALPAPQAQPAPSTGSSLLNNILQNFAASQNAEAQTSKMMEPASSIFTDTAGQLLDMFVGQPLLAGMRGISGQDEPGTPEAARDAMAGASLASAGSIGRGGMGAGPRLPERIEPPPIGRNIPENIPEQIIDQRTLGQPAGEAPSEPLAPKQPEISPASPSPPTPPPPKSPARQAYDTFKEKASEAVRDAQIKVVPMAAGNEVTQAIGKEFAVSEQLARYRRMEWDRKLREIPEGDRRAMWEAMDHASVAAQYTGRYEDGMRYLNMLPPEQRDLLMDMENKGIELWEQARAAGVVAEDAERLPFYIMRGIVRLTDEGTVNRVGADLGMRPRGVNPIGTNLRTRGPQGRQYLTSEETIAAARQRFGPGAELVKDIRALPLAYEKLEMATAGRNMVNDIKAIGDASGKELVSEGQARPGFFTMDHPAMQRSRPRFQTTAEGKVVPVLDENGNIVFDRVPIYISKEFEGPLRAVLRTPTGPLYRGAMAMKGGVMSLVLNSPMIHNQVIWGKALPAAPGKVASFAIYREGNKLMQDPKFMEEAIRNGMIPIGERGYLTDIEGIAGADDLKPGRSLTSKALGFPAEWIAGPNAGTAVRQAIDKAGDFWHYRLLWKQIGKLQAGLYQTFKDRLIAKGFDEKAAGVAAAHFANRYAGVLPNEAMSAMARKALNMVLFSRSFTVGNLGILKDMINGLPQDARAIATSSMTQLQKKALTSMARRKAIGVVATDLTMLYVGLALAQNAVDVLKGDKTIGAEAHDYVDRFNALLRRGKEHWSELLNPFNDLLALSPMYEHEPGKEFRIQVGKDEKGTGIYVRLPAGKFAEETMGWVTSTAPQLRNKLGFIARPIINLLANDNGLGQHIYNKEAAGASGVAKNIGNILWEFMRADIPELQIKGAMDFLTGQDRSLFSGLQAAGPLIGTTASHGYPGGPQAGKNALLKREVQDIRKQMYDLARHRTPDNAARTNDLIKGLQEDLRDREQEWLRRYPPPPKVGERGPMGGIVTHQQSYQQPAQGASQ